MSSNKPFPSSDLDVFKDNSIILDQYVNSQEDEFPDRFKRKRPTITGIIKEAFSVRTDISNMNETLIGQSRWDVVPKNTSLSLGGDNGALNKQAQALFNRTEMLKVHFRETLRRAYQEVGLNLVEGSFEDGGELKTIADVLLEEKTGYCYSWSGNFPKVVVKGTLPTSEVEFHNISWKKNPIRLSVLGADDRAIQLADSLGHFIIDKGEYVFSGNYTVKNTVIIERGAKITVTGNYRFAGGIDAGNYKIFEVQQLFLSSAEFVQNSKIIIDNVPVKASWFTTPVSSPEDILNVPDQTNNLLASFRAAAGNYIPNGNNFLNENPNFVLEFPMGYLRIDGKFRVGELLNGVYYRLTGGEIRGFGPASSFLIRTDLQSLETVFFLGFYTGQLTTVHDFKVSAYNPGVGIEARYASAARCGMQMQGDSLIIYNIWSSGFQIPVVKGATRFNGVGFQFQSCIDTYFHNLFTEYCVTGIAFHSSIVTGNNLEVYQTLWQGIGMGNFVSEYGESQTTKSVVTISGAQIRAFSNQTLRCIEGSNVGTVIHLFGMLSDSYDSENSGTWDGKDSFIISDACSLSGSLNNSIIKGVTGHVFNAYGSMSRLGTTRSHFEINNLTVQKQIGNGALLRSLGDKSYVNVNGLTLTQFDGVVLSCTIASDASINIANVYLSEYGGKVDNSGNRQLFSINGPRLRVNLSNFYREIDDVLTLNKFGHNDGAHINVDIPFLPNSQRVITGVGTATITMHANFV